MVWISVPSISGWAQRLPCCCVRQSPSALMDGSALCRHSNGPRHWFIVFGRAGPWAEALGGLPARLGFACPKFLALAAQSWQVLTQRFLLQWGWSLGCNPALGSRFINHWCGLTKSALNPGCTGKVRVRFSKLEEKVIKKNPQINRNKCFVPRLWSRKQIPKYIKKTHPTACLKRASNRHGN